MSPSRACMSYKTKRVVETISIFTKLGRRRHKKMGENFLLFISTSKICPCVTTESRTCTVTQTSVVIYLLIGFIYVLRRVVLGIGTSFGDLSNHNIYAILFLFLLLLQIGTSSSAIRAASSSGHVTVRVTMPHRPGREPKKKKKKSKEERGKGRSA